MRDKRPARHASHGPLHHHAVVEEEVTETRRAGAFRHLARSAGEFGDVEEGHVIRCALPRVGHALKLLLRPPVHVGLRAVLDFA